LIQQGVFLKPDPKREKRTKTPKIHKLKAVSLIPKKKRIEKKERESLVLFPPELKLMVWNTL